MIQPLRTLHRRAFVTLTLVLPVVIVVGLASRYPRQPLDTSAVQSPGSARLLAKSDDLWARHAMRTDLYSNSNRLGSINIVISPSEDLDQPDLLLYWSVDAPSGSSLPANARLVGSFKARKSFALPPDVDRSGYLVLFSLARQSVFDTAKLEKLP
jgi:hypothetical protein